MSKFDAFIFLLIFLFLGLVIGLPLYFYGWYNFTAFLMGLLFVFIPTGYSCYLLDKIFPSSYSNKWTLNGSIVAIIGVIVGIFCLIGYLMTKDYVEENELKKHGIETIGIIDNYKYRKSGGYYVVDFETIKNVKNESEINCKIDDYSKGDTVKVVYSERIPAINRAD
jgi:hypothetical protein